MSNPFVPTLVAPVAKGAADGTGSITFSAVYQHPDVGVSTNAYSLRRRAMTPTIGSYEYWNGTSWVGTVQYNAITVTPGSTFQVSASGFSNGVVYQWSLQVRDTGNNVSGFSVDRLLDVHAKPAPSVTQPSGAQTYSTPKIAWSWVSAAGKKMRRYRAAIYRSGVYSEALFDPTSPTWQAQAEWIQSDYKISTTDWYVYPEGFIIQPSLTYKAYGIFEDEFGLSSGWLAGPTFTSSVSVPAVPAVTLTPRPDLGAVEFILADSTNLLSDESADFGGGTVGAWVSTLNCNLYPVSDYAYSGTKSLRIKIGGLTYGELDTLHGTFANEDTAYATFEVMRTTQASPAGTARLQTTSGALGIPVTAGTAYSALVNMLGLNSGSTMKVGLRWYKVDGSPATTPLTQGSAVTIPLLGWQVAKLENAVAPTGAAYAAVEVEISSATVDKEFRLDAAMLVQKAAVSWVAGTGSDRAYVIERQEQDGTWVELWGAGRDNPLRPPGGSSAVRTFDRDAPLNGGDINYRAFMMNGYPPDVTMSAAVTGTCPALDAPTSWIRCISDSSMDMAFTPSDRQASYSPNAETVYPHGAEDRLFSYGDDPDDEQYSFKAWAKTNAQWEALRELLKSKKALVIQLNHHGHRVYGYVPEGFSENRILAGAREAGQRTGPLYTFNFKVESISRPEA